MLVSARYEDGVHRHPASQSKESNAALPAPNQPAPSAAQSSLGEHSEYAARIQPTKASAHASNILTLAAHGHTPGIVQEPLQDGKLFIVFLRQDKAQDAWTATLKQCRVGTAGVVGG